MSVIITPPFAGPWTANREGMVKAASGERLGYTRFETVGLQAKYQSVCRYWGASHCLANSLAALIDAGNNVTLAAIKGKDLEGATVEWHKARTSGFESLERLLDPMIDNKAEINAPIFAVIEELKRRGR